MDPDPDSESDQRVSVVEDFFDDDEDDLDQDLSKPSLQWRSITVELTPPEECELSGPVLLCSAVSLSHSAVLCLFVFFSNFLFLCFFVCLLGGLSACLDWQEGKEWPP